MKLYYYTSAQWAYDDVKNERIKISQLGGVNDPNEWTPFFVDAEQKHVPVDFAREFVTKRFGNKHGFVSLSKSWDIAPMWGLYADKYRGVVLEVESLHDDKLFKVDYVRERPKCSIKGNEDDLTKMITSKSEAWSFEQEMRYLHSLDVNYCEYNNGMCFAPMQVISDYKDFNIRLSKIILGPMMAQPWCNQFAQLCMQFERIPGYGRKIPLITTCFDERSYSVKENGDFFSGNCHHAPNVK